MDGDVDYLRFGSDQSIGLRPSRKWNLFNGELECKLLQFDMCERHKKIHKLR